MPRSAIVALGNAADAPCARRNDAPQDPEAAEAAEARSPEATEFAGLVAALETPLLRYLSRVAHPDDVEDIAQEAFLRLHRERTEAPGGVRSESAFLFRVAHNLALDGLRRKRTRERLRRRAQAETRGVECDSTEGLAAVVRRAAGEKALEELAKLPPEERRILVLKVVQDFSLRDVAEITGRTLGYVSYRLNQGLTALAARLKQAGVI
jgi:RNA polymerase sigma-70 factor (ECF subfamily)